MSLQNFFESVTGQIVVVAVIILLFGGILISGKSKKPDTKVMVASAILVALAVALNQIILFRLPQGGSVTAFSMLPVVLCGYFFGARRGIMAGICVGLLTFIFNPYVVHPVQMLLDYPLALGALGIAGFFKEKKLGLFSGYTVGVIARSVCSVLSGVIFFASFAPAGMNVWIYSILYNFSYTGAEGVVTLIILAIPQIHHTFERIKKTMMNTPV